MLQSRFSFFRGWGSDKGNSEEGGKKGLNPTLKLQTERDVYRPGDSIYVTIEICNPCTSDDSGNIAPSLLIEKLGFEIKGIEKLDTQWFANQKPVSGTKQRRGEHVFLDCSTQSMISKQIVPSGSAKTYLVRAVLPSVIPPSYKGATIRYLYYIKSTLFFRWLRLENGHSSNDSVDLTEVEARVPLQVWVTEKRNGLVMEDGQSDGIVPATTIQMDIYRKEIDGDSEWARVSELYDGIEEGYKSSRDEISTVSSFNLSKERLYKTLSSLSLQLSTARSPNRDGLYHDGDLLSLSSNVGIPRLSIAKVLHDSRADISSAISPKKLLTSSRSLAGNTITGVYSALSPGATEPLASEVFIRGRSYNIRMDDQVLLRFSPKNSDSTYYFSDMIGGTLTFFHEEGARRCLEVSVTLETSETISRRFVHPSGRNSPTITRVQSDHHEIVADSIQTSFLFSIPMDGPMSFSTPRVSVQWVLRFEFFTTPKNVDWTRYEHPLLTEGRDRCEWVLPITVHAPAAGTPSVIRSRSTKPFSLVPLWIHS